MSVLSDEYDSALAELYAAKDQGAIGFGKRPFERHE
jgi:hypothetical protein